MIEKFAFMCGSGSSEFLDLERTSKAKNLVSLVIAKLARDPASKSGALQDRDA
jgi:hypothetical protein